MNKSGKKWKSAAALLLALALIMTMPGVAAAEEADDGGGIPPAESTLITSFAGLDAGTSQQEYTVGKLQSELLLPATVDVEAAGADGTQQTASIDVSWTAAEGSPAYDSGKAGTYSFTVDKTALQESGYTVADGVPLPVIRVTLKKSPTSIAGMPAGMQVRAGRAVSFIVKVSPAGGRNLYLQQYSGGRWISRRKYTLPQSEAAAGIAVTLPGSWYRRIYSTWRLYAPATSAAEAAVSSTLKVQAIRVFQNPKGRYQIKDYIPTRKTTYNLKVGISGYKVYKVQKRLHCYYGRSKYTVTTRAVVRRYQRRHHLRVTGRVNLATWMKMGFSRHSWYYADSYVYPIQVTAASTKKQCIEAMIKAACKYRGTRYVWCAAARPKQGVDCAGLVIQALYAAGIDPLPQGSHVYAYAKNEYTTTRMWRNKKFKHVSFRKKKRGDIICYYGHVSIYLGRGRMIEALPGRVTRITRVRGGARGCLRPFV
ncbi:MAG: NlpC/P60 family protein [Anaerovoracaceae bacterium]|jgi:cell wall-associated NlpC family hydrolase